MANLFSEEDKRQAENQDDRDVDAGLRAKAVDIASFFHPWDDAVEESECDNIL